MGYALAEAARDRGAQVTLITAPATLSPPDGVELIKVRTVADMRDAVLKAVKKADVLIMAAAVSDFRVAKQSGQKIKKQGGKLSLELVENEDFLLELPDNFIKVGFAAESENMVANAKKKLKEKRLDMIVANDITQTDAGFDVDTNRVTIIDKKGKTEDVPLMSKRDVAERILDRVKGMVGKK
jgi:phosphopantothenoylcysteine decarboxylase/phosphopantothenate--cysteine ligase